MSSHQSLPVTVLPKKPSRHATRRLASSGLKVTQELGPVERAGLAQGGDEPADDRDIGTDGSLGQDVLAPQPPAERVAFPGSQARDRLLPPGIVRGGCRYAGTALAGPDDRFIQVEGCRRLISLRAPIVRQGATAALEGGVGEKRWLARSWARSRCRTPIHGPASA